MKTGLTYLYKLNCEPKKKKRKKPNKTFDYLKRPIDN